MNRVCILSCAIVAFAVACNPNQHESTPNNAKPDSSISQPLVASADTFKPILSKLPKADTPSVKSKDTVAKKVDIEKLITCEGVGPVKFSDTYESLVQKFGSENLVEDSVFTEGEFQGFSTIVWPNTDKQVTVYWLDIKPPFKHIMSILIDQVKSPWKLPNKVGINISLKELIKLNGNEAMNFYGFGWDYGGAIVNFGKGNLEKQYPCVGGILAPQKPIDEKDGKKILGDKEVSSSLPEIGKYDVRLTTLIISASPRRTETE